MPSPRFPLLKTWLCPLMEAGAAFLADMATISAEKIRKGQEEGYAPLTLPPIHDERKHELTL